MFLISYTMYSITNKIIITNSSGMKSFNFNFTQGQSIWFHIFLRASLINLSQNRSIGFLHKVVFPNYGWQISIIIVCKH